MHHRIRLPALVLLLSAVAAAPLGLAGCSDEYEVVGLAPDGPPDPGNPGGPGLPGTIEIITIVYDDKRDRGDYSPDPDTVAVGTTVRWVNSDSGPHTVTSSSGLFDLQVQPGGSASYTFTTAGTYTYYCRISGHSMNGTVVVTP